MGALLPRIELEVELVKLSIMLLNLILIHLNLSLLADHHLDLLRCLRNWQGSWNVDRMPFDGGARGVAPLFFSGNIPSCRAARLLSTFPQATRL